MPDMQPSRRRGQQAFRACACPPDQTRAGGWEARRPPAAPAAVAALLEVGRWSSGLSAMEVRAALAEAIPCASSGQHAGGVRGKTHAEDVKEDGAGPRHVELIVHHNEPSQPFDCIASAH